MHKQPIKCIGGEQDRDNTHTSEVSMTYAAIYARTSSPNQKDNYSIGGQIGSCVDYCERNGWKVSHIFVDECLDAKSIDHRPKFQLMLEKAKAREFSMVIGWKLDRLCRSLADVVNVERTLRQHGVQLCTVTELIDSSTSIGRFNFRNLASWAELESEMTGERSRLGLYALARERRWPNGLPPLGYTLDANGKLLVVAEEASVVRGIFRKYLTIKSMPELAYRLNQTSVKTKSGNTGIWNAHMVRHILNNRLYVGQYHVAAHIEDVPSLRIINPNTFNKVQQTMHRYLNGKARRKSMQLERKQAKSERVLKRYHEFLSTMT